MQRRTLLRRSAALGAVALAGCGGDGDGKSVPTPPPDAVTGFGEWNVRTTNTVCSSGDAGSADASFSENPLRVTVTGTIVTPNPCYAAALEALDVDQGSDTLTVTIGASPDDSGGCEQCIGGIEYEGTFNLEGGLPGTVVVEHTVGEETKEVATIPR